MRIFVLLCSFSVGVTAAVVDFAMGLEQLRKAIGAPVQHRLPLVERLPPLFLIPIGLDAAATFIIFAFLTGLFLYWLLGRVREIHELRSDPGFLAKSHRLQNVATIWLLVSFVLGLRLEFVLRPSFIVMVLVTALLLVDLIRYFGNTTDMAKGSESNNPI